MSIAVDTVDELQIPENAHVVLPPHGFVALQDRAAKDLDVINAARVSLRKQSGIHTHEIEHILSKNDVGLIGYLMRNRHGTPFEHNYFKFQVRCPIFVMREWVRHRIGISINEESARYTSLKPMFYLPENSAVRAQVGKPGKYTYEPIDDPEVSSAVRDAMNRVYCDAFATYEGLIARGIARELARAVLPVGIYTNMIWSANARSLMNFLNLRATEHAQYEIRQYALAMDKIFAEAMPVTHAAFVANGRIAP